jgi:hypothetical protein
MTNDHVYCGECVFWEVLKENRGECRRHPPVMIVGSSVGYVITEWPATEDDGWCGDGRKDRTNGNGVQA